MFEFERAVLSGREVEGLSLLGDNDGRLHERLDELQRRTRESVWNMQPWLNFDPYDPYDELNARSRSVGHQVRLILPPSGLTRNPLISSKYPIVRIGPVPLPLMVIDGSVIVYEGSRAPNSNMTVWVLTRPDWVAPALAMWSAAWEVSRPALDDPSRPPLSARQYAVACFLAQGLGDDAIARKVAVSRRTVASDVRVVMDLVGAQTRFQAGTRLGSMAYTVDRS
ncbi:DNA-binding response regulator [Terracoccus luteus]|nr:DNA-binding response regulator [Terracoccus luteus]MCP2171464.1 DNA-binding CsgD family transcriptional regulator [Terracoccus luteus]